MGNVRQIFYCSKCSAFEAKLRTAFAFGSRFLRVDQKGNGSYIPYEVKPKHVIGGWDDVKHLQFGNDGQGIANNFMSFLQSQR
jgi:hypothetical protein